MFDLSRHISRRVAQALASGVAFLFLTSWGYFVAAFNASRAPDHHSHPLSEVWAKLSQPDVVGAGQALHQCLSSDPALAAVPLAVSASILLFLMAFLRNIDFEAVLIEAHRRTVRTVRTVASGGAIEGDSAPAGDVANSGGVVADTNDTPAEEPLPQPRNTLAGHLFYAALGVTLIILGVAVATLMDKVFQVAGTAGGLSITAGIALVTLGVAIVLYRVLEAANVNSIFRVGGTAAASVSLFAMITGTVTDMRREMETQYLQVSGEFTDADQLTLHSAAGAPINASEYLDDTLFAAHLRAPEERKQVLDYDVANYTFAPFPLRLPPGANLVRGVIAPAQLQALPTALREQVRQPFCFQRRPNTRLTANPVAELRCAFGHACGIDELASPGFMACPNPVQAADTHTTWLAPNAFAEQPSTAQDSNSWSVPDLRGACIAYDRFKESFNRFDLELTLPAGLTARSLSYEARINGTRLYINGEDPEPVGVRNGAAHIVLPLQNLNYSGRSGATGGFEDLEITVTPRSADGTPMRDGDRPVRAAFHYEFAALRTLPDTTGSSDGWTYHWRGRYVFGHSQDGQQIFVHSQAAGADLRSLRQSFDSIGLIYHQPGSRLDGLPVVGIVRPRFGEYMGVGLAVRLPDGRHRFTFPADEARAITTWYAGQRAHTTNAAFTQFAAAPFLRPLVGDGASSAADAGCPSVASSLAAQP